VITFKARACAVDMNREQALVLSPTYIKMLPYKQRHIYGKRIYKNIRD